MFYLKIMSLRNAYYIHMIQCSKYHGRTFFTPDKAAVKGTSTSKAECCDERLLTNY